MAEVTFFYSTMAAGKSTSALQLNYSLKQAGFEPQLLKPHIDVRDVGVIRSRIGIEHPCTLIGQEYIPIEKNTTHVIIDEAQFLSKKLVQNVFAIADSEFHALPVYCFGLKTSYTGDLFEGAAALLAGADNIIELPLISWDGNKAVMHIRYVDGKPIFEGDPIFVGDIKEEYKSVSRKEYYDIKFGRW